MIGKHFRKDAKQLMEWLTGLTGAEVEALEKQLSGNGYVSVDGSMVSGWKWPSAISGLRRENT